MVLLSDVFRPATTGQKDAGAAFERSELSVALLRAIDTADHRDEARHDVLPRSAHQIDQLAGVAVRQAAKTRRPAGVFRQHLAVDGRRSGRRRGRREAIELVRVQQQPPGVDRDGLAFGRLRRAIGRAASRSLGARPPSDESPATFRAEPPWRRPVQPRFRGQPRSSASGRSHRR